MTNKEKAAKILTQLDVANNHLNNALDWQFPNETVRDIQIEIITLQDQLIAMIPD